MKMIVAVIASVALLLNVVDGLSTGAPAPACAAVSPNPDAQFHNATAQTVASPFTLRIQGSPTVYMPGQQYTCECSCVCVHISYSYEYGASDLEMNDSNQKCTHHLFPLLQ